MAGFRLNDGSLGCPPTENPPASYASPFRLDSAGRLWITQCFKGFRYFGAARHDISTPAIIGSATVQPSSGADIVSGNGLTAGTYRNIVVTNNTECTLGLLVGLDSIVDLTTYESNIVVWTVTSRWNGVYHSASGVSNPQIAGATGYIRQLTNVSANPHDSGIEGGGAATMSLAPGATGTVSAKMFVTYNAGSPTGLESVSSANSAVRVYGYIIS